MRLKITKDSCSGARVGDSGPVLFLQAKQNSAGVFGSFCPNIGDYTGVKSTNGFAISTITEKQEAPNSSVCADGLVVDHQYVELDRVIKNGPAFTVKYKIVRTCKSPEYQGVTCSKEYGGVAFHETHRIWPAVPENYTQLAAGCTAALQTCSSCHAGLNNLFAP